MIKGDVSAEITFYDGTRKLVPLGSNMILDNMGEQIVQALTTPPDISSIPSASSILDTSNYTIQAISFGKPQASYYEHAHTSTSAVQAVDGLESFVGVYFNASSYNPSAFTGKPQPASPTDERLEDQDTSVSGSTDVGHNLNGLLVGNFAAGCYPESTGTSAIILSGTNNTVISGVYSSRLNLIEQIDASGFINMTVTSTDEGFSQRDSKTQALVMTSGINDASRYTVEYMVDLSGGDFLFQNLYGGIYSIGLWCMDLKEMLRGGLTPPYTFNNLNNPRKYKLVAKKVLAKDLTFGTEVGSANLMNFYDDSTAGSVTKLRFIWGLRFV